MKVKTSGNNNTAADVKISRRVVLNENTKRQSNDINVKDVCKSVRSDLKVLKKFSFG